MLPIVRLRERIERDARVEAVPELGAEEQLVLALGVTRGAGLTEADRPATEVARADVAGHEQDDVAEVRRLAVVVRQFAVIHDLEEHVEDVGVGLLDLVEEEDRVRRLRDGVGQETALVEADVPRRRADEARDGVPFHVLAHVEAEERDAHHLRELLGAASVLPTPVGPVRRKLPMASRVSGGRRGRA